MSKNFLLPIELDTYLSPCQRELLKQYDYSTPAAAMQFVLDHWLVFFEDNPERVYDLVEGEVALLSLDVDGYPYYDVRLLVEVFKRAFKILEPYLGTLPIELSREDRYAIVRPYLSDTFVALDKSIDDVCEDAYR